MKLMGITEIKGKIILKSGLHVGAGDTEMRIGGTDNTVIKHPHTQEPYIPGSSLKGKVRSLLEMRTGLMVKTQGNPVSLKTLSDLDKQQKEDCEKILKIFGTSGADSKDLELMETIGPTRVSFADCSLNEDWKKKALENRWPLTEVKSENAINRIRGVAENPRFFERVPANAEFNFSVTLKQLGDEKDLLAFLLEGLRLLELDALGRSGSRGYGRIKLEFDDPHIRERFDNCLPFPSGG